MTLLQESKNTHMDHLEDLPFLYGSVGLRDAIRFQIGLRIMLKGESSQRYFTTVKVDGAPAVFVGTDPQNGKFFVQTKSLFNKEPKVNYTNQDIDKNHEGGLAQKLKLVLKYLKPLGIQGILQGDLMFDDDIKKAETIEGEEVISFQPNTIKYTVPKDSDIGRQIQKQKIGVVFHTTYTGQSITTLKAKFGADVSKIKNKSPFVWVSDQNVTDVSGTATLTKQESDIINQILLQIGKLIRSVDSKFIDSFKKGGENELMGSLILIYTNQTVSKGTGILDAKRHMKGLEDWLNERYQKEQAKVKTDQQKEKRTSERDSILEFMKTNKQKLLQLFTIQELLTRQKIILLRKLEKIEGMTKQFIDTGDGYKVTKPEGFVIVSHQKGNAVKIIDRLEFSRANMTAKKVWKESIEGNDK